MSDKQFKFKFLLILTMVIMTFTMLGTVSADSQNIGSHLTTVKNGTVNGGVYIDSYYGFQSGTNKNVTYKFKSLPKNTKVVSATLYTIIYSGDMTVDKPVHMTASFNGKQIDSQNLSSTYNGINGPVTINNHCNRVTSDYLLWYDVTSSIKENNTANVYTDSHDFDGRIKLISLVVAYDNGSSNKIAYWINQGHDVVNTEDYVGSTKFSALPKGNNIKDASLNVIHLSSTDGIYTFNGNTYPGSGSNNQGSYSGMDKWNVTRTCKVDTTNTLTYQRSGDYYKIILAILSVNYTKNSINTPDLTVSNVSVNPSNNNDLKGKFYSDNKNTVTITIKNQGTGSAGPFKLLLKLGNYNIVQQISGLGSGSSTKIMFNGFKPAKNGNVIINLIVDNEKVINESNESNNGYIMPLKIITSKLPDLYPKTIVVPANLKINKNYSISVKITNKGTLKSGSFIVRFYADGIQIGKQTIKSLTTNGNYALKFNWMPKSYGKHTLLVKVDPSKSIKELNESNNELKSVQSIKNFHYVSMFLITDDPGTNIMNTAANSVISKYKNVAINLKSNSQIQNMSNTELETCLKKCDIFMANWLSTKLSARITNILNKHPEIAHKKIFLVLEPQTDYNGLMKYSKIGGISVLQNFTSTNLSNYLKNTALGTSYKTVVNYVNKSSKFPSEYNRAVLYKDLYTTKYCLNQLLWSLSYLGFNTTFTNPPNDIKDPVYGVYRNGWFSYIDNKGQWHSGLDNYKKYYFHSGRPTVGLLESTKYVNSNQLMPYNAIIRDLESRNINVIPIVAYGGSSDQLEVMLRTFTNATQFNSFIKNQSQYKINVDGVVDMTAYGLGGNDFSKLTQFFKAVNVPVIAAVHSDYESNAQYELGSSGLRNIAGDKWWHIAILEAQGIVSPIFVGGQGVTLDPNTGAKVQGYIPYTPNIKLLGKTLNGWTHLKYIPNSSKKIALIYYNYPPGKQNIAASYLDPVQSIYNLLYVMKKNGYNVKNIPANELLLLDEMMAQGTNIAKWAPGLVNKLANNNNSLLDEIKAYQKNNTSKIDFSKLNQTELNKLANIPGVILYPASDFLKWFNQLDNLAKLDITQGPVAYIGEMCKRSVKSGYTDDMNIKIDSWNSQITALLPTKNINKSKPILQNIVNALKAYVKTKNNKYYSQYLKFKSQFLALKIDGMSGWGAFPGNIMTVTKNGKKYFVLPGIQFGNTLIAPEPQRGWEGNADQLYHNSVVPPHYQYLAFYAYLQQQGYDSMVYMGRHATHEWLPGKEVLPEADDFTNIVTGGVPQTYFYIMDGLSEGITAKRRGSAVIIDHLTPPMGFTQLYGGMSDLESLVEDYDGADSNKKQTIITKIKKVITDNNLAADIGINLKKISQAGLISAVNKYLSEISNTFYPDGVDVIGKQWSDDQIALLVTSILSVPKQIPTSGIKTTSLQNEVALLLDGKPYSSLNAAQQNEIQSKCIKIVKELLHQDIDVVLNKLTKKPSKNLQSLLQSAKEYSKKINESVDGEVKSFLNALNGGYILPGLANDPINNPDALPTGKNFYQDQAAEIPTMDAYIKSQTLTLTTLKNLNSKIKKIAIGLWDVETARDDGELVSMILRLLGMAPNWTDSPSAGSGGAKLQEMPVYTSLSNLVRPAGWAKKRIDVVVVIDGNFRDLYSRQVGLIDKAFKIALARSYYTILADKKLNAKYGTKVKTALNHIMSDIGYYGLGYESLNDNYVAYDWVQDFKYYLSKGMNTTKAGDLAISRIFAPPENDYGANIAQSVRMSWTWKNSAELANNYLNRMGHIYSDTMWGELSTDAFKRSLSGISTMYTTRNTNLYGIVDNDDFFDYWGGLSMALNKVNGKTPNMYVLKYGNGLDPTSQTISQYLNRELNTRYFNPQWIKGMMGSGYVGASYMSKFVSNLYGWQVTRPSAVSNAIWNQIVDVYYKDKNNLGVDKFLENGNNAYAKVSISGTMLTAAYNGQWKASKADLQVVANSLAQMVIAHGVACCDCSCGNIAMLKWATQFVNPDMLAQFNQQLYSATQNSAFGTTSQQQSNSQQSQAQSQGEQSSSSQSQSSSTAGPGEDSGKSTSDQSSDNGKSYEINPQNKQNSSSQTGMPIYAILGVIMVVGLLGWGYFRSKPQ